MINLTTGGVEGLTSETRTLQGLGDYGQYWSISEAEATQGFYQDVSREGVNSRGRMHKFNGVAVRLFTHPSNRVVVSREFGTE